MRQVLIISGMVLCAGVCCLGRTITVALDGSGEFSTIQTAIDAAAPGDVIVVAPGRYVGSIAFGGKDIVLTGMGPWDWGVVANTIIDGAGADHVVLVADAAAAGTNVSSAASALISIKEIPARPPAREATSSKAEGKDKPV